MLERTIDGPSASSGLLFPAMYSSSADGTAAWTLHFAGFSRRHICHLFVKGSSTKKAISREHRRFPCYSFLVDGRYKRQGDRDKRVEKSNTPIQHMQQEQYTALDEALIISPLSRTHQNTILYANRSYVIFHAITNLPSDTVSEADPGQ